MDNFSFVLQDRKNLNYLKKTASFFEEFEYISERFVVLKNPL